MGLLAAIRKLSYSFLVFTSWLASSLTAGRRKLHSARFARLHELDGLAGAPLAAPHVLLGVTHLNQTIAVKPTRTRRELGNLLVVAPTRGGKGLLIVNDIKGELFAQTAGFRSRLGPVFVIDPTGIGHRLDPLATRRGEDELFSAATHLLFKPDEGEGAIFTQRATVMLTQIFLAAREEGRAPLPYARDLVRKGLAAAAAHLNSISPELATQFLDVAFTDANLAD